MGPWIADAIVGPWISPAPIGDMPAGVVLAGGASRRMGRDKATMPHPAGGAMVQRVVAVLAQRCEPVFVVAAQGQVLPDLGAAQVLRDVLSGAGPLPATGLGLAAAAAAGRRRAFVCAVDMPALEVDVIDELAGRWGADSDVVLAWDGRDHYLAALYRTALARRIEALVARGERRMRSLTDVVRTRRVVLSDAGMLANLNRPVPGDCG